MEIWQYYQTHGNIVPDDYCGSRRDFIIPSSCLNATVSGLFSRTIRNSSVIGKDDFDGAVYYNELESVDKSIEFLDKIESYLKGIIRNKEQEKKLNSISGMTIVNQIAKEFGVKDINKIKPRNW